MKIKKILLIDDNETDQFLHETVIKEFDPTIEIMKAYDGQQALDLLSSMDEEPDIILLDINMPGMNGFEFLDEYNRKPTSSVIAMLSSSEQGSDKEKAMSCDCVKIYFLKPLEVSDLASLKVLSD